MRTQLCLLLLLSFATACAAAADSNDDTGTEEDTSRDTSSDVSEDVAVDTAEDVDNDPEVDADTEDAVDATEEVTEDVVEEDALDATEEVRDTGFVCDVLVGECEPSSSYCTSDGENDAVGFCSRCGSELRIEVCDVSEVCDDTLEDGADCRPCEGDECPVLNACEPRERTCLDFNTVQICGVDGTVDSVADCAAGRRCFDGSCGSPGAVTAETCETNIDADAGCNGHTCLCGDEHGTSIAGAPACASNTGLADGYCTTSGCAENQCDTRNEACVDFGISGSFDGGAYCVSKEDCTRVGISCGDRAGFVCTELPGRAGPTEPVTWNLTCWTPLPRIGAACTGDSDCVGGTCRTADVSGVDVSYCTMACGDDAECPSNAACLDDPDGPGFICMANPDATSCPRLETQPLLIASTPPLARFGRGSQSACYFAR